MTDPGDQPTRVDTEAIAGANDPTVVGVAPIGPETEAGLGGGDGPPPGSPPPWGPPPRDRRPWILVALLAAIVLVLLLLLLLRDDGSDDDGSTTTTTSETSTTLEETTTSESTTTSSSTTTTETTTTTTGAPPVTADPAQCREAGADPGNPDPAAQAVFIAWTRGDVACARELMTDEAFDQLFARPGADATDVFQGCVEQDEPEPHVDCAFTYEGGATHYRMRFSPTDGWQVVEVYQVAD